MNGGSFLLLQYMINTVICFDILGEPKHKSDKCVYKSLLMSWTNIGQKMVPCFNITSNKYFFMGPPQ